MTAARERVGADVRQPHWPGIIDKEPENPLAAGQVADGSVLLLTEAMGYELDEDDEQLVVALAAAAGVAIDNAQLYAAAQRRQRWLVAAGEITEVLLGRWTA